MRPTADVFHANRSFARSIWGKLSRTAIRQLMALTSDFGLVVATGDLQLLQGRWYVTHTGLLRLAKRRRCLGIETTLIEGVSDPANDRWVFKASVYKSSLTRSFVGFGDANPSNVSTSMQGAELRIAETRAVNRALRKAYGIGLCSVEELGASAVSNQDPDPYRWASAAAKHSNNGQPRLRDQLCVLIRQHNLDPALVKAYAADFCGTATLAGASRELIESFISHLSSTATENRDSLVCKLNSYAQSAEARP
jgi:hypothetical protein